jgi:hypothetical protein
VSRHVTRQFRMVREMSICDRLSSPSPTQFSVERADNPSASMRRFSRSKVGEATSKTWACEPGHAVSFYRPVTYMRAGVHYRRKACRRQPPKQARFAIHAHVPFVVVVGLVNEGGELMERSNRYTVASSADVVPGSLLQAVEHQRPTLRLSRRILMVRQATFWPSVLPTAP